MMKGYNLQYKDKPYRDAEWLRSKYWDEGLTQREIGGVCGVTKNTIGNWMTRHGIETRDEAGCFTSEKRSERIVRDCANCGDEVRKLPSETYEHSFCDIECFREWNRGENHPTYKPNGGEVKYGYEWRSIAEDIRDRDGRKCQNCGMEEDEHFEDYGQTLDVHHIIPRRLFDVWADVEDGDVPRNLITLCRNCHRGVECGNYDCPEVVN